ncbi:hypothetical protein EMCRGX_G012500 [Ephydatia muelleri]
MVLPRCFFDIAINGVPTGRIVFELFTDVVPKTCENFRCLCTGEKGEGKTTFKPLHYKGTPIHRIVKGFIVQGGDFSSGDGTGGESIYGGMFEDESYKLKHERPFLLSMANKGPNTNGSQFFITTCPTPHLDGIHVVFGQVVDGKQYVKEMENQKVDANHRPYADVRITNSGELVLMKKGKILKPKNVKAGSDDESEGSESSSTSSSSSSSEGEEPKKKKEEGEEDKSRKRKKRKKKEKPRKEQKKKHKKEKKKKKKKAKKVKKDVESSEESEAASGGSVDGDIQAPPTEGDLPPDVNPESKKSWLYRFSKSPSPNDPEKPKVIKPAIELKQRENVVSFSGRKLKGRGTMQYRTPPPPPVPLPDVVSGGRWDRRPWEHRPSEWRRKERSDPSPRRRSRERSKERSKVDLGERSRDRSRSGSSDGGRTRKREHGRRRSRSRERGHHSRERSRDRRSKRSNSKHSRSRSRDRGGDRRRDESRRSRRNSSRSPRRRASGRSKSPANTQYSKWARHGDTTGTSSEDEAKSSADEEATNTGQEGPPPQPDPVKSPATNKNEETDLVTASA